MEAHFVGRQAELAVLRGKLDDARSGHPGIVLVQGPPGIGKTALVERFVRDSVGALALRASGEESESLLTYGVLDQLLRFARLDGAASAAAALTVNGAEDHITTGARLLDLLGGLEERSPVVVAVDDIHWADPPSLRALLFGLRRLVAERVLVLMVVREEQEPTLPEGLRRLVRDHGVTLRLAGLPADNLRELAAAMGIETVSSRAAQRLHDQTQGNPLHARALLEELPADTWCNDELPLPSPRSFSLLVLYRCTACSPETQRLVEAASVLGSRCSLAAAACLAGLEQPLQALEEANKAGLLQPRDALPGDWTVAFPHPLVQAAVYHDLAPSRRAALHAAAAELGEDEATSLRHRVAAAPSADAPLAQDLEAFARRQAARGAATSAAASLVTASRLSATPVERERRLLEAVSSMLLAADRRQAAAFAEEIAGFPPGPLRDKVLGYLAYVDDRPREAERWLQSAWEQCDPANDGPLASAIALTNLLHWKHRMHGQEAVEWGRRAVTLASPVGDPVRVVGEGMLATALAYAGRLPEGLATVESAITRVAATPEEFAMTLKTTRGWLRLIEDDVSGARADLTDDASARLRVGISDAVPLLYSWLAWVEYCIGAWDDAVVHAARAHVIALELEHPTIGWLVPFAAVPVPAARGDWAAADRYASLAAPDSCGYEQRIVAACIARATLATARAHHDDVLAALDPLLTMSQRQAVDEPGYWPWQDLYGDALVHQGRLEEASVFLGPHESLADQRGRHAPIARLARVRGRLEAARGNVEAAETAFQRGLRHIQPLAMPFERALLELAYGQFLRRYGRRRDAAARLGSARDSFISLGAGPWLERCDRELMACGLAPAKRRGRDQEQLTPQELCVARLAASGLSNREVAAELMVSVKTVEFHLSHTYHKLAVGSRKELASRLQ